jgi:DNA polymerase elongation subunit (family B)
MDEIIAQDLDIADFEYINNDILIRDVTSYRNRSINPVYAVFVTAYARKVLYEGMETVISLGGKVYYVDTDCIITDVKLPASMVSADALGLWDLEEEIKEGVFLAPKLYKTESVDGEHHIKAKGCTVGMREEIENIQIRHDSEYGHHFITVKTFDKFRKLLTEEGYDFKTKNKKVTGFFEQFRRLNTDKERFIGVIETKKSITGKYNKRELTDRINTKPLYYRAT